MLVVVTLGINITLVVLDVNRWLAYANRASYELVNVSASWYIIKPDVNASLCPSDAEFSNGGSSSPCGDDLSSGHRKTEADMLLEAVRNDFKQVNSQECVAGWGIVDVYRNIIKKSKNEQLFFAITFWITLVTALILNLFAAFSECCELHQDNVSTVPNRTDKCQLFKKIMREIVCKTSFMYPTYLISAFDFSTPCIEYYSRFKFVGVQAYYIAFLLSGFYAFMILIDFCLANYNRKLACVECCWELTRPNSKCWIRRTPIFTICLVVGSIPILVLYIFLYYVSLVESALTLRVSTILIGIDIILSEVVRKGISLLQSRQRSPVVKDIACTQSNKPVLVS
jgi:hypothetical protein